MTTPLCIFQHAVDDHFRGTIDPPRERALRGHLAFCAPCREHYARLALYGELSGEGLDFKDRLRIGLGLARPRRSRLMLRGFLAAAAAAVLAAVVVPLALSARDDGFSARGAVSSPQLAVYRVAERGKVSVIGSTIAPADELAFAYANPTGKPYLLVFGADETKRLYWFYPAWTSAKTNPSAVAIEESSSLRELEEAISQDFKGRELKLYAVFAEQPFRVRDVELKVSQQGIDAALKDLGGAAIVEVPLHVRP